jgi:hypothetical protein
MSGFRGSPKKHRPAALATSPELVRDLTLIATRRAVT